MMLANDPLLAGDVDLAVVVIVLVKAAITLGVVLLATMLMIWFERKAISGLQNRIGPNRAGPFGILQTLADGLKVILKEDLVPDRSDRIVFRLAPVLTMVPAFITFGLIPLGGDFRDGNGGVIEVRGYIEGSVAADHLIVHDGGRVFGDPVAGSQVTHPSAQGRDRDRLDLVRGALQPPGMPRARGIEPAFVLVDGLHDLLDALATGGDGLAHGRSP